MTAEWVDTTFKKVDTGTETKEETIQKSQISETIE